MTGSTCLVESSHAIMDVLWDGHIFFSARRGFGPIVDSQRIKYLTDS